MKKYGLQLRVQPNQKKQPTRPPFPNPLGFNNDDDDDNVKRDILRQAYKNKTLKDIKEQHKKALAEDPSVFDYDGVYDKMKEKQVRPVEHDRKDRQPRYIAPIKEQVKQRKREHEIIYERKLAKERSHDEHLYADKDKFVTSAYKKKLAEQEKSKEAQLLREMREEKDDVTKKTDISDFYFNLGKNIAFGAKKADLQRPEKLSEEMTIHSSERTSPPVTSTTSVSSKLDKGFQEDTSQSPSEGKSDRTYEKPIFDTHLQGQETSVPVSDQLRPDHHKRSEDAVAATKARFLARKKGKLQ